MNMIASLASTIAIDMLFTDSLSVIPLATEAGSLGTIRSWLAMGLILIGAFFLIVGTVGLLRMPNMYNRMHATTKSTTVGVVSMFLAAFVVFGPGGDGLTAIIAIVFLFLTVPTGSHLLLQSAIRMGVPFEEGVSWPDED